MPTAHRMETSIKTNTLIILLNPLTSGKNSVKMDKYPIGVGQISHYFFFRRQ